MAEDGGEPLPTLGPGKTARNERRKLLATWLNALASGTVTVGVLAPAAGILYGFSSPGIDRSGWVLAALPLAWFLVGLSLHSLAQVVVGGLEE